MVDNQVNQDYSPPKRQKGGNMAFKGQYQLRGIDPAIWKRAKMLALTKDQDLSVIIRQLLTDWVEKEEKKLKK